MKLPKAKQQSPEWQAATEALLMAAEDRGPLVRVTSGMLLALHGAKPIPEYNPSKEKHWGQRKRARRIKQTEHYLDGCGESGALSRLKERGRLQLKHPNVRD